MNIYFRITIKSSTEGYLYTFGMPLGITGTGAHAMTPRTLEKLSASIDNIRVYEQEKVFLQFTMANPILYGIRLPVGDPSISSPVIAIRADLSKHSGLPVYQLFGKTWIVTHIQVMSSIIVDAINM